MQIKRNGDVLVGILDLGGKRVLDVGCGQGSVARLMAKQGATVIGVDVSPTQLADARAEPPVADEIYLEAGGEDLPFDDASFDIVVIFNSLHHIPGEVMDAAMAEAARVTVPGGRVFVCEPIADGDFFRLMLPIDDETEVRAQALAVIDGASRHGLREAHREEYLNPVRYRDYDTFRHRITAIDPARAAAFEKFEPQLREAFETGGDHREDGVWFHQPTRIHMLVKDR